MRSGVVRRTGWRRQSLRWYAVGLLALGLVASALAGCDLPGMGGGDSSSTAQIPTVSVTAKDFSLDMPDSVSSSGLHAFTLTNSGAQPHQMNIARLNDGVTEDEVKTALAGDPAGVLPKITFVGGPNLIEPGKSQTATVDLTPGTYVGVCFMNDVKDPAKTHAMEGMYKFFTVPQSSGSAPASPADNGLVTLQDFHIGLPSAGPFHAGTTTWKVWNHGSQPHEMGLLKLNQGKSEQDALTYLEQTNPSGPPPFTFAGGIAGLGLNKSGWVTLNLDAGNYVALCFVPDPSTGKPHFMLGMETPFTVQ